MEWLAFGGGVPIVEWSESVLKAAAAGYFLRTRRCGKRRGCHKAPEGDPSSCDHVMIPALPKLYSLLQVPTANSING